MGRLMPGGVTVRWQRGRLIVEIATVVRIPIEIEPVIPTPESRVPLSTRESQVLDHVLRGKANKEIGSAMNISERTVKYHVSSLLQKFGVSGRLDLGILLGRRASRSERLPEGPTK